MKFTCDLKTLNEAVTNISLAVSQRSNITALEGVLLECTGDELTLTGYNLELGIRKTIPVRGEESGNIVLNARIFSDILRKAQSDTIKISTDEKLLTLLSAGNANFTILGISKEEYPDIPQIDESESLSIRSSVLKSMIRQTIFAVAVTDQNPLITGSLFDIKNGNLHIVSVDGYRLALAKETVDYSGEKNFVVPGRTLQEISKLMPDEEEAQVTVQVGNKHIIFIIDGYYVISRLLEGEFLNYNATIPDGATTKLRVKTREFIDIIDRVSIIINDKRKPPVKCELSDGMMSLFCESSIGKVDDQMPVQMEGASLKIGFNNKYMTDALKATEADEIYLEFNGPVSPIKLLPLEGESFLFLVLPVRLKDGN
ncbi:MAG TPA: DNA polymerase III subunit beta [Firmicutes bacterium]|nr:DNA polymerase III subunit beta [Bacillota bacterium]